MGVFIGKMKVFSLWMLEPPWRHSGPAQWEKAHWLVWFVGSVWSLAGLVLGAVVAPSLVQSVGHLATPYQGALGTGVAVLAGFLVQSLGWLLLVPTLYVVVLIPQHLSWPNAARQASVLLVCFVFAGLPFVGIGYTLYRYFTWVGAGQGLVPFVLLGGLLIKTLVIPAIVGAARSKAFKVFMDWLRGGKPRSA